MSLQAKTALISDLEDQESELQTAINNAARDGVDTLKPRGQLKTVQAKLTAERHDVASIQAAGREAAAHATGKIGDELAGVAIERIVSNTRQFAEVLTAGVPSLDLNGHANVTSAMHNVAGARQVLADAEAEHASAVAEVNDLSGKIATKRQRHAELVQQRVSTGSESGAAEIYALSEDVRTLDAMHVAASVKATSLAQPVNDARISLRNIEMQAAKIEHRVAADHLEQHARALETAYLDCLRACQAEGAKAGVTLGALHPTSLALRTWVTAGHLINR